VEVYGWEARYYDLFLNVFTLGSYPVFIRRAVSFMDVRPGDRILDLGCGTGRNVRLMLDRLSPNIEVTGVDVSQDMLNRFRRRFASYANVRAIHLRIEEPLPFEDEFDCCCISFVLHGLPHEQRERVLDNVRKILKPGGRFFILDYNEFTLEEAPFYFRLPFKYLECSYAEDFISRDWQAILGEEGFLAVDQHLFYMGYVRLLTTQWPGRG
jgi:demethylmenaquinone methyltransferase/2-methoxy-6-polyprenyl-1,4-benzoquinol methylase